MPHELLFGLPLVLVWLVAAVMAITQDDPSERWIGWLGIGLVLALGVLVILAAWR